VIRFLNVKNIDLAKIHAFVVEVYGEGAMKERNVRKWCRLLKNYPDEERSGVANSSSGKFPNTPRIQTLHQVIVTFFCVSNFWLARVRGETKRKQDVAQGRLKGRVAAC